MRNMPNRTDNIELLRRAELDKSPIVAIVHVGDEIRARIGTVALLVDNWHGRDYVTFSLQDGSYRSAHLRDVERVVLQ